jgi:predicted kinase
MVGLPGSGKTTLAQRLEKERGALRLTADEWMVELFGQDPGTTDATYTKGVPEPKRDAVEAVQWSIALRALELGLDVVIDWGLWSREEREKCRREAAAVGACTEIRFLDVPRDELWRRLSTRNVSLPAGTLHVDEASLDRWLTWFEPPTGDELHGIGTGAAERPDPPDR